MHRNFTWSLWTEFVGYVTALRRLWLGYTTRHQWRDREQGLLTDNLVARKSLSTSESPSKPGYFRFVRPAFLRQLRALVEVGINAVESVGPKGDTRRKE